MRLLFLSNVYPHPLATGKGTFNASFVRALADQDRVRVICPVAWTDRLRNWRRPLPRGPVAIQQNLTAEYPTYYFTPRCLRSCYDEFMDWSIGTTVLRAIREHRPEAVVSYWAHPDGAIAVKYARQAGIPAIVMVGGSDVLLLAKTGRRRRKILDTLHRADRVVAVSQDIATRLEQDGISPEKLRVIRRGVRKDVFHPGDRKEARIRLGLPESQPIAVAVGRLVGVKGFDRLIDAFKKLFDDGKEVLGFIIGEGELKTGLQKQIDHLGLTGRVFLKGAQSQTMLSHWYRAADVTVLSSWSEGIPNVLLESISCGTPFVATNVGGVPEIADSVLDRLVNAGDVGGLATGIEELLLREPQLGNRRFLPEAWEDSAELLRNEIRSCLSLTGEESGTRCESVGVVG